MATLNVSMKQMNKWKCYEDNIDAFDMIVKNHGKFVTLTPDKYTHWLHEFNIFYTLTK